MSQKLVLISSDGKSFKVDQKVVMRSNFLENMVKDGVVANKEIKLSTVTGKTLEKIVEFCEKHVIAAEENTEHMLTSWDAKFVESVDEDLLFDLMKAADFLSVLQLLDLTLSTVAAMMEDKNIKDIRKLFSIKNDYTAEEEAQFRQENQWAFEDVGKTTFSTTL